MLRKVLSVFLTVLLLAAMAVPAAAYGYDDYDYDDYSYSDDDDEAADPAVTVLVCIAVGLVVALIVTGTMKAQLKTVRHQAQAGQYIRQGSFQLFRSQDIYLYRNVTRVARPKDKK